jgi:hypothetical protein
MKLNSWKFVAYVRDYSKKEWTSEEFELAVHTSVMNMIAHDPDEVISERIKF